MPEGRALVFPVAIALGARPLVVPGGGAVLVVSAFYAFRLSDGAHVRPATWYETVAARAGPEVIPDSMCPLPGAELLVLGAVAPPAEESRDVLVRCGALRRRLILRRDPAAPDTPVALAAEAAVWHEKDNPVGRGGPEDDRPALIVDRDNPERPVWLGPTPYEHPLRLRLIGTPDETSGTGWPPDADPAVLHDAHPSFRTESFHPGEPLELDGLGAAALESSLPAYRISITSGRMDARFVAETARIHAVSLIPAADLGAMFWRATIAVGDDILGESVVALIAALEDSDSSTKDPEHWGRIAAERWVNPDTALDDRPLLPAALAATVSLPFATPAGGDPIMERHAAADAWMRGEMGVEENPFGGLAPKEAGLADAVIEEAESGDAPPDANAIGDMADAALAASRQRHADAGFKERGPDEERVPERRGERRLAAEIEDRLSRPYRAERERALARAMRSDALEGMDAGDVLNRLAGARIMCMTPLMSWPAFEEDEAGRFGEALAERLSDEDLERHVDVSGAVVAGEPGEELAISGRRLDGVLAEETVWRDTVFSHCEFVASAFTGASFESCRFESCRFDGANLSKVGLGECTFVDCSFASLRMSEVTWYMCRFERCAFEDVSITDLAMREIEFEGGSWQQVSMMDGVLIDATLRALDMQNVTFSYVHAPQNRLERISMCKVTVMGNGFPVSVFEEVEGVHCGFLGMARFDQSSFSRVRFAMTGFTNAIFADARFEPGCEFEACDLSGAVFANVMMERIRFLECLMTASKWSNVNACEAWFYGARLRGVDFADTELARAVFTDADIEGTAFLPDKTIGADFRGTVKVRA
jgi:uncharacterized protein YjbI with pentapeptide repeats